MGSRKLFLRISWFTNISTIRLTLGLCRVLNLIWVIVINGLVLKAHLKHICLVDTGTLKKKPKMTLGGTVTSERIGLLQRTSFYGTYSYNLKINKKANISFGLGVGGVQHNVKIYDARPYDHDDSFMSSQIVNGFAFDANAGFYFYTKNFFLGFSDQHMPNSKILWSNSIGRLTQQFYAYTGYNFYLDPKKEWVLQPSILARTNSPGTLSIGIYFKNHIQRNDLAWFYLSPKICSLFYAWL